MNENLSETINESLKWFDENFETLKDFIYPVCKKHSENAQLIDDESQQLFFDRNPKSTDYPHLYSFCREGFQAFQKIWYHFKDEREKLYNAFFYRVVEYGLYNSFMDYLIECIVIYLILSLLNNTADGSSINFWIAETVVSKKEWEDLLK